MSALLLRKYGWLINLLKSKEGGYTLKEINEFWSETDLARDCSTAKFETRTFSNIKNDLKEFGINICCRRAGQFSKYYIDDDFTGRNAKRLNWLMQISAMDHILSNYKDISDKIMLEQIVDSDKYVSTITEAMRNNQRLVIDYKGFLESSNYHKDLKVDPLCLRQFNHRWYMLCRRVDNAEKWIFSLDRIIKCVATSEKFEYPGDFKAEEFFENYVGISTDGFCESPCSVLIKAYKAMPKYLESLPLHASQIKLEETPEYTKFGYSLIPTNDLMQELLSHCNEIEVVSPKWLREKVADALNSAINLYK